MGQVTNTIIGIDTTIFIYVFNDDARFGEPASNALRAIQDGVTPAVFSTIGVMELLVGPKQTQAWDIVAQYKDILKTFPYLTICDVNESIIDCASDLRARYNIHTPDAIHLATAIVHRADLFLTNDRALTRVRDIRVELL